MPTVARKHHTLDSVGGMCGSPLTFSLYSQTLRAWSCAYARRAPCDATHERECPNADSIGRFRRYHMSKARDGCTQRDCARRRYCSFLHSRPEIFQKDVVLSPPP